MPRRKKGNPISGWLVIDKPTGMGSTDVVRMAKRVLKPQKVGHAGTLDPFATGILPLAFGEATKTIPFAMDATKYYDVTIQFGQETDTLDPEGDIVREGEPLPTKEVLKTVLRNFIGEIEQTPPAFSAVKIDGKRAYDLARAGEEVELKSRPVSIHAIELINHDEESGVATLSVTCGKGTYIRSLARDIAYALDTCATVTALRRTKVGAFSLDAAISLEKLESLGHVPRAESDLLDLATVLDDIPALAVTPQIRDRFRQGQPVRAADLRAEEATNRPVPEALMLIRSEGRAVALAERRQDLVWPVRVFNDPGIS